MRETFDYYPTPRWMTLALMRRFSPRNVLEPCSGRDAIANVFREHGEDVVTADIDPTTPAHWHLDATKEATWVQLKASGTFWTVTNPPFNKADQIVPLAVKHSHAVAMVLRLSWLEPTNGRAQFLKAYPPDALIVLPRTKFRGSGTDSVTSAWFIWHRFAKMPLEVVTKEERDELIAFDKARRAA